MQRHYGCALITRVSSWLVYSTIAQTSVKKTSCKQTHMYNLFVVRRLPFSKPALSLSACKRTHKIAEIIQTQIAGHVYNRDTLPATVTISLSYQMLCSNRTDNCQAFLCEWHVVHKFYTVQVTVGKPGERLKTAEHCRSSATRLCASGFDFLLQWDQDLAPHQVMQISDYWSADPQSP